MSNKMITMQQVRSIIGYLLQGYTLRAICRALPLSRPTITVYAARLQSHPASLKELQSMSDGELSAIVYQPLKPVCEDDRKADFIARVDYFLKELKRTGVTRLLLWQAYRKRYPSGYSYTQFCVLLSTYSNVVNPSMRFDYQPAETMMIDFTGEMMSYVDKDSGEIINCPVLVCVLPYSGYSFVKALPNATLPHLMNALNDCLLFFGGAPHSLKTDNMKQIVSKPSRYEPAFTEAFTQWAQHNNIALTTARIAKPKDKAPVENEVKITYRRIYAPLRDSSFFSLEALNQAIAHQLNNHHNQHFQKKDYSRKDCFDKEEKHLLQPLPPSPFVIKHRVQAKVQKNYHITLGEDWHHYSIPYQYIGKTLTAVYDTDIVEIYFQHQRIALHKRGYKKHGYTTLKEHMPHGHQLYFEQRGWTADYFLKQAEAVGVSTKQYIEYLLKGKHFTEQTYNACLGIMRLAKQYGNDRLEAACTRALTGGIYTYRTIDNILKNNLDKQALSIQTDLFKTPPHDNLRGAEAYQ
jgi:transposase